MAKAKAKKPAKKVTSAVSAPKATTPINFPGWALTLLGGAAGVFGAYLQGGKVAALAAASALLIGAGGVWGYTTPKP